MKILFLGDSNSENTISWLNNLNEEDKQKLDEINTNIEVLQTRRDLIREQHPNQSLDEPLSREIARAISERDQTLGRFKLKYSKLYPADDENGESIIGQCCICLSTNSTHVYERCGHMCVCNDCAHAVRQRRLVQGLQCPICKQHSSALIRVYHI